MGFFLGLSQDIITISSGSVALVMTSAITSITAKQFVRAFVIKRKFKQMPAMTTTNRSLVHYGAPLHLNHRLVMVKVRTVKTVATALEVLMPIIHQSGTIAIPQLCPCPIGPSHFVVARQYINSSFGNARTRRNSAPFWQSVIFCGFVYCRPNYHMFRSVKFSSTQTTPKKETITNKSTE